MVDSQPYVCQQRTIWSQHCAHLFGYDITLMYRSRTHVLCETKQLSIEVLHCSCSTSKVVPGYLYNVDKSSVRYNARHQVNHFSVRSLCSTATFSRFGLSSPSSRVCYECRYCIWLFTLQRLSTLVITPIVVPCHTRDTPPRIPSYACLCSLEYGCCLAT
jgi:hypothetical protein